MSADASLVSAPERQDAVAMRKAHAQIVILDDRFGIAYAQDGAIELLAKMLRIPKEYMDRLPLPIELAIQETARNIDAGQDVAIEPVPSLLIRVAKLAGRTGGDPIVALQIEHRKQRQSLTSAVKRFKITTREAEVLTAILRGKSSTEIAEEMCIAEATVADYVKRLLRKTFSKNRAELLAKIFDWQPEER